MEFAIEVPGGQSAVNRRTLSSRTVRDVNKLKVLAAARKGAMSRSDIAHSTGLSYPTVRNLIQLLMEEGFVKDGDVGESRGGRRPGLLEFIPSARVVIGMDFDAPRIRAALANLDGKILADIQDGPPLPPEETTAQTLIPVVSDLLERAESAQPQHLLGIGISVRNLSVPSARVRENVLTPLQAHFGVPVEVDHNSIMALIGETRYGAAIDASDVIYVNIGQGISAGLMLGGNVHRGASQVAGEFGHVSVDMAGPICETCGRRRGCLESYVSSSKTLDRARLKLEAGDFKSLLAQAAAGATTGSQGLTLEAIAQAATAGDMLAREVIQDTAHFVSMGITNLINVINPQMVVIGGNAVARSPLFLDYVRSSVYKEVWPTSAIGLKVTQSLLGDRAKILGAVSLILDRTLGSPISEHPFEIASV